MAFHIEDLTINVTCTDPAEQPSAIAVLVCGSPKSPRQAGCHPLFRSCLEILGPIGVRLNQAQLDEIKAELKKALAQLEQEL